MKNRILFFAITLALSCVTYQPIQGLSAAELWNSQSSNASKKSGKNTYYNSSRKNNAPSNGKSTLYNGTGNTGTIGRVSKGSSIIASTIKEYKNLQVRKNKPSKMWGLLSPAALKNRQADIDNALKIEYDRKKGALAARVRAYKNTQKEMNAQKKEHAAFRKELKEQREAYKQARLEKKMRALGKSKNQRKTFSSNNRVKTTKKSSNKPKRIFNIPD